MSFHNLFSEVSVIAFRQNESLGHVRVVNFAANLYDMSERLCLDLSSVKSVLQNVGATSIAHVNCMSANFVNKSVLSVHLNFHV